MRDPNRLPPFTDRRRLPPVFPGLTPVPPPVKEEVARLARENGDDPADVLADLLLLAADELEGPVMDERKLGFAPTPWSDDPAPGRKPQPGAPPAPPAGPKPEAPAHRGPQSAAPASPGGAP